MKKTSNETLEIPEAFPETIDKNEELCNASSFDSIDKSLIGVVSFVDSLDKPLIGVVTNCFNLNIRSEPDSNSEVLCVVPIKDVAVIDKQFINKLFYKVRTTSGFNGFCMKEYISINQ